MIPEVLQVWMEVIAAWDGKDQDKLTAFLATIRGAMSERDMGAAQALCQALIGHELEDAFLNGRLCLYSALSAPRDDPAEWLELAASFIAEALDNTPGDAIILEWQQKVAEVQSQLKPVEEDEDLESSVKPESRRGAKGKKSSPLTGVSALSIDDPALTKAGSEGVKHGQMAEKEEEEDEEEEEPYGHASLSNDGSGSLGDAAPMAGVINKDEDGPGMRFNMAEQYAAWKAEAGVVSQAEYNKLYAQHLEEMEALDQSKRDKLEQQKGAEKDEDVLMQERSTS